MKALRVLALAVVFFSACVVHRTVYVSPNGEESYQTFYNELSPYGQWVNYGTYGYVWIPNCGPAFTPYSTGGHWAYTDYGWTWCSNYSWGWAPFHYGSWGYDNRCGWYWVPGHTWGPAWVSWRHCNGYYGWAPLGPDYVYGTTVYNNYYVAPNRWCFVDQHYMGSENMEGHYGPRDQYETYVRQSTVIGNTSGNGGGTLYTGPARTEVEQNSGHPIAPYHITQNTKPGQSVEGNNINMYQPKMTQAANTQVKPTQVSNIKEVTPIEQRPVYKEPVKTEQNNKTEENQVQQHNNQQQQKTETQQQHQQQKTEQRVEPQREPERQQQQQQTQKQMKQQQKQQQKQQKQQQKQQQPKGKSSQGNGNMYNEKSK
jgi:hypothetical protein